MRKIGMFKPMVFVLCTTAASLLVQAQNPPASDPKALALAAQAVAALTRGNSVKDTTLFGSGTWIDGARPETGPATFDALGFSRSRMKLKLASGARTEVRTFDSAKIPRGAWMHKDQKSHDFAIHNNWTDAVWFFPALSSLSEALTDANVVLSYVGQETLNGMSVQHLRSYRVVPGQSAPATKMIHQLSVMDFYLNAASSLPMEISFQSHADVDFKVNAQVEIRFADYRLVNGIIVPFRFQKILNSQILLDVTVSDVTINSGLPPTDFDVPQSN